MATHSNHDPREVLVAPGTHSIDLRWLWVTSPWPWCASGGPKVVLVASGTHSVDLTWLWGDLTIAIHPNHDPRVVLVAPGWSWWLQAPIALI